MKEHYLLTIKAEDRLGLLHLITGTIEKRQAEIKSLNAAPTDIHGIVLVTVEITIAEKNLTTLALKLENIIEVFSVQVTNYNKAVCLRAAYFKLAKSILESPSGIALSTYDTTIVQFYPDAILVAKYGKDVTIRKLYNALDGPDLLGFSQTGLIADSKLIPHEDIERISGLAA